MEEENAGLQHGRKKVLLQGGKGSEELKGGTRRGVQGGLCVRGWGASGSAHSRLRRWHCLKIPLLLGWGMGGSASFPDLHSHHTFPLLEGLLAVPSSL